MVPAVSIETRIQTVLRSSKEACPARIVWALIDLSTQRETARRERIRRGLAHVPAERVIVAPDCGMKYLPREVAFRKLQAMVEGAAIVRREIAGAA